MPLVRLQVVAESDSEADQQLKLELRDTALECARVCLADAADAEEAYMRLCKYRGDFEAAICARAREANCTGEIKVETGVFDFPDRLYGDVWVPAGKYRALRITIGAGEGHNWWCVLYPSLCILDENEFASEEIQYHSEVLNWLKSVLGGEKG